MKYRARIYYTEGQKALMWERWRKGESLQRIAQLFDRNHSSIRRILAETGGICPAQRCRSRWALRLTEREAISRSMVANHSIRSIAASLRRAPSTISREIRRNGDHASYRATPAEQAAWDRAARDGRVGADLCYSRIRLRRYGFRARAHRCSAAVRSQRDHGGGSSGSRSHVGISPSRDWHGARGRDSDAAGKRFIITYIHT